MLKECVILGSDASSDSHSGGEEDKSKKGNIINNNIKVSVKGPSVTTSLPSPGISTKSKLLSTFQAANPDLDSSGVLSSDITTTGAELKLLQMKGGAKFKRFSSESSKGPFTLRDSTM